MNTKKITLEDINNFTSIDFWKNLMPEMTITEHPFKDCTFELNTEQLDQTQYVDQMKLEGYVNLNSVLPKKRMDNMANIITKLFNMGIPPVLCFVYDDFWKIYKDIAPVMNSIIGEDYMLMHNRWAWYVPPGGENTGFKPHRDMPISKDKTLQTDGMPMIATIWIPLREVYADNACIHLLPQNRDPNIPDHMERKGVPPPALQNIRALPGKAGSIMSWNPKILHWGSRSSAWRDKPRISIGTYLMRSEGAVYDNGIKIGKFDPITFDFRLGVIGAVMEHYDDSGITDDKFNLDIINILKRYIGCTPDEWHFHQAG